MSGFSRRQFIKVGAGGLSGLALSSVLPTGCRAPLVSRSNYPRTDGDRVVPTSCYMCHFNCAVRAHVKDGVVTKIVGHPADPHTGGRICGRGISGVGQLYDPDRLKQPLIRVSKRGEDRFEAVSWATALDKVAEGMLRLREKYGPSSVGLLSHGPGGRFFFELVRAFGSNSTSLISETQCNYARELGLALTFGDGVGDPESVDIENTRCLTLIGNHLGENMHVHHVHGLADLVARGGGLVVVDPRFSVAAGKARYWLPIKPGTDIALLLAWMNVIIGESLYDRAYVEKHAVGLDRLSAHVADKTPEWASGITDLDAGLIRETARYIASFRPASLIHPGRRQAWYGDDTQRVRAIAILAALLGSWGRRGGYLAPPASKFKYKPGPLTTTPFLPAKEMRPPLVDKYYPCAKGPAAFAKKRVFPEAASVLRDRSLAGANDVRAWILCSCNPFFAFPDEGRTLEALQALELVVAVDTQPSEICGWADVVLPECTYLERHDIPLTSPWSPPFIVSRRPVVEPMYDTKPSWWIAKELGQRVCENFFPWKDFREFITEKLKASGIDFAELEEKGILVGDKVPACEEDGLELSFETDSKKIELYSELLAAAHLDPLPTFTLHEPPPPGTFRLLSGRVPTHSFSRTQNNALLSSRSWENEVWVSASAAKSLPAFAGRPLASGERVILVNQDGVRTKPIKARVTERIRPDCVFLAHGFGHTARGLRLANGRGANVNQLATRYKMDPVMAGTGMNVNFVQILPAEQSP